MIKLDDVMEMDHVIQVTESGEIITTTTGVWAPEVVVDTDADGQIMPEHEAEMIRYVNAQGWTLERGWTGQYGYSGPIMHPSEFIGGALEEYIRATPGYWVATSVESIGGSDGDAIGWVIAHRD